MKMKILATISLVLLGLPGVVRSEEQKQTPAAKPPVTKSAPAPTARPAAPPPAKTNAAPVTSTAATAKPAREEYIVIGYLERRDGTIITIKSGPRGPAYSVAGKDGKVQFDNLTSEQLRAKAPEIHEFLKSAVADSPKKPVKDGSLMMR